jgi:hypothetical protein
VVEVRETVTQTDVDLTGKLSDIASLVVFPLVPYAAIDLWRARRGLSPPSLTTLAFWIAATGLVMATINTIGVAADAYRWGLGAAQWPIRGLQSWSLLPIHPVRLTEDPTDLVTLPALVVPWFVVRSSLRAARFALPQRKSSSPACRSTTNAGTSIDPLRSTMVQWTRVLRGARRRYSFSNPQYAHVLEPPTRPHFQAIQCLSCLGALQAWRCTSPRHG